MCNNVYTSPSLDAYVEISSSDLSGDMIVITILSPRVYPFTCPVIVKPESARDYQEITITGHVNGYTRGDNIVITIISPDKSEEEISTYASRDGDVYTLLHMTEESQIGNYKMILKYDGTERASTEF